MVVKALTPEPIATGIPTKNPVIPEARPEARVEVSWIGAEIKDPIKAPVAAMALGSVPVNEFSEEETNTSGETSTFVMELANSVPSLITWSTDDSVVKVESNGFDQTDEVNENTNNISTSLYIFYLHEIDRRKKAKL